MVPVLGDGRDAVGSDTLGTAVVNTRTLGAGEGSATTLGTDAVGGDTLIYNSDGDHCELVRGG